ncbi:MAG: pseudouridine synthase, partial [Bacteroidia bacterium]|nr:rRNA pseudouridine synthase [Bacteroidia bacterium]MDW8157385.1 pseudouridine synthase [Bacteroidia bacterium]
MKKNSNKTSKLLPLSNKSKNPHHSQLSTQKNQSFGIASSRSRKISEPQTPAIAILQPKAKPKGESHFPLATTNKTKKVPSLSIQKSTHSKKKSFSSLPTKPQPQFILKDSKIITNPKAKLNRRLKFINTSAHTPSPSPVQKVPSMQRGPAYYRLNRYIAQSGLCSRREADILIKEGRVKVNGKTCTDLSTKVLVGEDTVSVNGKIVKPERLVYILLNKPKNCITTANDPEGRKTVMDLVKDATPYRIFPVGRLDRNTTGILLFTNDGELAKKLTHPSHKVRKLYYVRLDKPLAKFDMEKIKKGVMLKDGLAKADKIDYV